MGRYSCGLSCFDLVKYYDTKRSPNALFLIAPSHLVTRMPQVHAKSRQEKSIDDMMLSQSSVPELRSPFRRTPSRPPPFYPRSTAASCVWAFSSQSKRMRLVVGVIIISSDYSSCFLLPVATQLSFAEVCRYIVSIHMCLRPRDGVEVLTRNRSASSRRTNNRRRSLAPPCWHERG